VIVMPPRACSGVTVTASVHADLGDAVRAL
jgi:hypothetical protein